MGCSLRRNNFFYFVRNSISHQSSEENPRNPKKRKDAVYCVICVFDKIQERGCTLKKLPRNINQSSICQLPSKLRDDLHTHQLMCFQIAQCPRAIVALLAGECLLVAVHLNEKSVWLNEVGRLLKCCKLGCPSRHGLEMCPNIPIGVSSWRISNEIPFHIVRRRKASRRCGPEKNFLHIKVKRLMSGI